jgi:capsular polysaccharide biosynthesis protein
LKTWKEEEYILHYNAPCTLEPEFGWAYTNKNELIPQSIPYSNWNAEWTYQPLPNRFDRVFKLKKNLKLDKAISLNMIRRFGKNYFQFHNSLLGQIWLLEQHGIDTALPIIVPATMANMPFFKAALETSSKLKNYNWVFHDNQFIKLNEVIFAKNIPYVKPHLSAIAGYFDLILPQKEVSNNKLFITRGKHRIRHIANSAEIEAIALKNGFEVIDTDSLSFSEQIKTFRNASHIIAIHGAGLTNMIFRYPHSLALFEILSEDYVAGGYYLMASSFGWDYNGMVGDKQFDNHFYLDPDLFEINVTNWIKKYEVEPNQ